MTAISFGATLALTLMIGESLWRNCIPGYSDDELYDIMVKSNAENLYDERVNLNIQLSQPIIVIATSADGTAECRATR